MPSPTLATAPRPRLERPVPFSAPLAPAPIVEQVTSRSSGDWDAYVAARPDATLYHLRAWKTVAERAYEMEAPFLLARRGPNGPVCGALPLVRIPRPFSPILASGIFGCYGPLLADDAAAGCALVDAARRLAQDGMGRLVHLKLLGEAPRWLELQTRKIWVTVMLDVRAGRDALWTGFSSGLRNKIRFAQRAGLTAASGADELEGFYDVLDENMTRKGSPMYGRRFMRALFEELSPRCDIITLRHGGRTVSGALIAWFNGALCVPFASSRPSAFKLHANELLYWEMIQRTCALGLRTFDFGSSLRGSSGLKFKGKWGSYQLPVTSALYSPSGAIPALEPKESLVAQTAVKIWSHLPRPVVGALGPSVCRWIA